jgi:hypothetical protein
MAFASIRMLQFTLALLASMIVVVLTPTVGHAHGNDALQASVVAVPEVEEIQAAAQPSIMAQAPDLAGHHHEGRDANCPTDGSCCNATCHVIIDLVGSVLSTRSAAISTSVPADVSRVSASPILGLFRPPRSL